MFVSLDTMFGLFKLLCLFGLLYVNFLWVVVFLLIMKGVCLMLMFGVIIARDLLTFVLFIVWVGCPKFVVVWLVVCFCF